MLQFQDFVPRMLAAPAFFRDGEYESFDAAVAAANRWIAENDIRVVNVETVVLPNIWKPYEEGSTDTSLGTSGESPSHWHQFVRVWHRVDAAQ